MYKKSFIVTILLASSLFGYVEDGIIVFEDQPIIDECKISKPYKIYKKYKKKKYSYKKHTKKRSYKYYKKTYKKSFEDALVSHDEFKIIAD